MPKITLKAARVNAGLSQKEAAQKLGISNRTLWQWENGITAPNMKYVNPICELYSMPVECIIFLDSNSI